MFPEAKYQRCTIHFYRNVFSVVPKSKVKIVAKMLKAIHAQESKKASHESDAFMQLKIQNRQTSARFADFGTPEGTRTPNPQNRNLMLYPLSHRRICIHYYSR